MHLNRVSLAALSLFVAAVIVTELLVVGAHRAITPGAQSLAA